MTSTPQDLNPGDEIPGTKYIVVRRLSSGGHGTIYLVRNRDLPAEKRFALKILSSRLSTNADLNARLLREAHLQASIEHPNVVAVYDAGMTTESPPRTYLLMERLRGENLQVMIHRAGPRGLGLASIYDIGIQVTDALECAHEHGAIHRDIKPDNIFVHCGPNDDKSIIKVLDFGVAYFMGLVQHRTGEVAIGTPVYMAPEQFRGERPTPRTDLYALGLVLYEMVTGGKRPFAARTIGEIGEAHLRRVPPPPSTKVDVEVPHVLEQMIMQMLEKDPSAHPPSARYVGSKLREMKREAEIAYGRAPADDGNKTDETPLQNIMMATRASETNPSPQNFSDAFDRTSPGTPKAKEGSAARALDATVPGMDLPPLDGRTLEEIRPGFSTQRMTVGSPHAPTPPPSMAVTRSLPQEIYSSRSTRTDTEDLSPSPASPYATGDRFVAFNNDENPRSPRPAAGATDEEHPTTGSAGVLLRSAATRPQLPFARWRGPAIAFAGAVLFALIAVFGAKRFLGHHEPSSAGAALPTATTSTTSAAPTTTPASSPAPSSAAPAESVPAPLVSSAPSAQPSRPGPVVVRSPPAVTSPIKTDDLDLLRTAFVAPSSTPPPTAAPPASVPTRTAPPASKPGPKPKRDDGWELIQP
jgi:serine/threonine-protein kinase